MAANVSAGLLMFRHAGNELQVLLAHPGGPFFRNKDDGYWSIPKGLPTLGEDLQAAAVREFQEETGLVPQPPFLALGDVRQKAGKRVHAWAFRGDLPRDFEHRCNTFEMEWPPRSGHKQVFPEVDRVEFFSLPQALQKINEAQASFLTRLGDIVATGGLE